MTHHDRSSGDLNRDEGRNRPFLKTPLGFALCVSVALAGVYLWVDHRVHILGALPLLLPLAICLGMHVFMHRGHGGHGGGRHDR